MLAKKPKGAVERKRGGGGAASLLWMFVGAILTLLFGLFLYLWNPFEIGSETKVEEHEVKPITQEPSGNGDYEFYDLLPEQEITSIPDEAIIREEEIPSDSIDLEPDVVITQPTVQEREPEATTGNYGIGENTADAQDTNGNVESDDIEMVIIEEEGTYDEPLNSPSDNGTASSPSNDGDSRATSTESSGQATIKSAQPAQPKLSYILQINSFSNAQDADKRRAQVLMAGVDAHVVKNKLANGQVLYQVVSSTMTNRQNILSAQQRLQNNGIDSLIVEQRR